MRTASVRLCLLILAGLLGYRHAHAGNDVPNGRFVFGRAFHRFDEPWTGFEVSVLPSIVIGVTPGFAAFEGRVMIALTNDLRCLRGDSGEEESGAESGGGRGGLDGDDAGAAAKDAKGRAGSGVASFSGAFDSGVPAQGGGTAGVAAAGGRALSVSTASGNSNPIQPPPGLPLGIVFSAGPDPGGVVPITSLLIGPDPRHPGNPAARPPPVAEPSSLLLLASMIAGLAFLPLRRRAGLRRRAAPHDRAAGYRW